MPELPDIELYLHALRPRLVGQPLRELEIFNAFVLRSFEPPPSELVGRAVVSIERLGKRLVFEFSGEGHGAAEDSAVSRSAALLSPLYVVIHLMIAGRFRWREGKRAPAKLTLATFEFPNGTLAFTEAGSTRRASMHIVQGRDALAQFDRGGLEVLDATADQFAERLRVENHTVKRSLTDPRLFSGIGNAYSDEILHRARMSPMKLTKSMTDEDIATLFDATKTVLVEWTAHLVEEIGDGFPEKVTAFKEGMAVHGRYGEPCPVCGSPVQRIRYATNETNYCARCQTGGRLLADRAMSRLLKQDWPRSIDELD